MIGTKITDRMGEIGIKSQTELAQKSGLSVQYISDLIHDKRGQRMSVRTQEKLIKALRVKPIFFSVDSTTAGNSAQSPARAETDVAPCT